MKVRHATPRKNLQSIRRHGLLASYARGSRKAVYVHIPCKTGWAVVHTSDRHKVLTEDVTVIEMDLPRHQLVRMQEGLYYTWEDIPVSQMTALYGCREVSLFPETEGPQDWSTQTGATPKPA